MQPSDDASWMTLAREPRRPVAHQPAAPSNSHCPMRRANIGRATFRKTARLPGGLEHVHPAVPVRADSEPPYGRPDLSDRLEFLPDLLRSVHRPAAIAGFALTPLTLPMRL